MGFEFYDRIYWAFLQLVTTFTQITIFDWALSTSDNTTLIHCSAASSEAEQSRAVAYCRQPASTITPVIEPRWDPWPYICSMSNLLFFPFFRCSSLLIKREGLDFFMIGVLLLHALLYSLGADSTGKTLLSRIVVRIT
jgi:hypothetical protein